MTNKTFPRALILLDIKFTNRELQKVTDAFGGDIDETSILFLQHEIGIYLAATALFHSAGKPTEIRKELDKLINKSKPLMRALEHLLNIDEEEEDQRKTIFRLANEHKISATESPLFGMSIQYGDWSSTNDIRPALANIIESKLEELLPSVTGALYLSYRHVQFLELTLKKIKKEISSQGGAPGDPYLDNFFIKLIEIYQNTEEEATYSDGPVRFVDVARKIAANRLEDKDFKEAAQRLRHRNLEGLKDRIKEAKKPQKK